MHCAASHAPMPKSNQISIEMHSIANLSRHVLFPVPDESMAEPEGESGAGALLCNMAGGCCTLSVAITVLA